MPETHDLSTRQTELVHQLRATGAPTFEHDHSSIVPLGTAAQVRIQASQDELRTLNLHPARLLDFDRSKAPRWVFTLRPSACEFA